MNCKDCLMPCTFAGQDRGEFECENFKGEQNPQAASETDSAGVAPDEQLLNWADMKIEKLELVGLGWSVDGRPKETTIRKALAKAMQEDMAPEQPKLERRDMITNGECLRADLFTCIPDTSYSCRGCSKSKLQSHHAASEAGSAELALLCCPFCGEDAEWNQDPTFFGIGCNTNGCHGYQLRRLGAKTQREAINAWNKRAI